MFILLNTWKIILKNKRLVLFSGNNIDEERKRLTHLLFFSVCVFFSEKSELKKIMSKNKIKHNKSEQNKFGKLIGKSKIGYWKKYGVLTC